MRAYIIGPRRDLSFGRRAKRKASNEQARIVALAGRRCGRPRPVELGLAVIKTLGLTAPPSILARATEVIE